MTTTNEMRGDGRKADLTPPQYPHFQSRLEFNDVGHIVRHEDTWGMRETIEGTIPFASVGKSELCWERVFTELIFTSCPSYPLPVYALERRVVGYLCSFAIGRGLRLSAALSRSITGADSQQRHPHPSWLGDEKNNRDASDAARALLLGQQQRQEQVGIIHRLRRQHQN